MSGDDADRSGELYAADREPRDQGHVAERPLLEGTAARWQRFVGPVSPVFEGAAVSAASTAVAATVTVGIDGGPIFYTLAALVTVSLYFKRRL